MIVRKNGEPHKIYTRDPNAPFMNGSGAAACRLPSGHPERGAGITLENCNDMTIGHCQVLDPLHCGIELRECTRCIVDGCTVIDRKNPATMVEAIRVVGGADNQIKRNFT